MSEHTDQNDGCSSWAGLQGSGSDPGLLDLELLSIWLSSFVWVATPAKCKKSQLSNCLSDWCI